MTIVQITLPGIVGNGPVGSTPKQSARPLRPG